MPTYLNQYKRGIILDNVKKFVAQKYEKSPLGKEIRALNNKLAKAIRAEWKKHYPLKDMKVLEKYNVDRHTDSIRVSYEKQDKTFGFSDWGNGVKIKFKPPLIKPDRSSYKQIPKIVKAASSDEDLISFCELVDKYDCEQKEILSIYRERLYRFRTVERLLSEYPDMDKFLDGLPNYTPTKSDKLIETFEKESSK